MNHPTLIFPLKVLCEGGPYNKPLSSPNSNILVSFGPAVRWSCKPVFGNKASEGQNQDLIKKFPS